MEHDPRTLAEAEAARILGDPASSPEALDAVARQFPHWQAHVVGHPNAPRGLLSWLARSPDPGIQAALRARDIQAVQAPNGASSAGGIVAAIIAVLLVVGLAVAAVGLVPRALAQLPGSVVSTSAPKATTRTTAPRTTPAPTAAKSTVMAGRPGVLPACSSGASDLAWATFTHGWLSVCGQALGDPTQWRLSTGGVTLESEQVTFDSSLRRYTAFFSDDSTAWLSWAPAMVGWTDPDGTIVAQTSVTTIWFAGLGSQKPASGSFGVPVPTDTAADQVRYLSEIIAKSQAARADLTKAVVAVRACKLGVGGYASEVSTIEAVADNRYDLLDALESAPVDKVPDGVTLINELRQGLWFSYQADKAYLEWATAVDSLGCGAGSEADAKALSAEAGKWKTAFADRWNSTIAGAFGVPTVARENL